MGCTYVTKDLPSEDQLRSDLHQAVRAYLALTFRGGLDPSAESPTDHDEASEPEIVIEGRRRKLHFTIERDGGYYAAKVKRRHGTVCQACGFDFTAKYGKLLGYGFIEAHHLRPLSTLKEGERVAYDIATDFTVLCSNCHRMRSSGLALLDPTVRDAGRIVKRWNLRVNVRDGTAPKAL